MKEKTKVLILLLKDNHSVYIPLYNRPQQLSCHLCIFQKKNSNEHTATLIAQTLRVHNYSLFSTSMDTYTRRVPSGRTCPSSSTCDNVFLIVVMPCVICCQGNTSLILQFLYCKFKNLKVSQNYQTLNNL